MANILIVDDNERAREILVRRLSGSEHDVFEACDGANAYELLATLPPVDLVLLDIMMPNMDGFDFLRLKNRVRALDHVPIIVVSSVDDMDKAAQCIALGADDFLTKPAPAPLLSLRIRRALEKRHFQLEAIQVKEQLQAYDHRMRDAHNAHADELNQSHLSVILALSALTESKDHHTGAHLERIREYCRSLATQLDLDGAYPTINTPSFRDALFVAAPLHDIGKVGIPDSILMKPSPLSPEEWSIMRTHTTIGANTLRVAEKRSPKNSYLLTGIEIAASHHEKWNGEGYPYGLKAHDIPLSARILALADYYDALVSDRPYKRALRHSEAASMIRANKGTHFDPVIVDSFERCSTEFCRIRAQFSDS